MLFLLMPLVASGQVFQTGYFVHQSDTTFGRFKLQTYNGQFKNLKDENGKTYHSTHTSVVHLNGLHYEKVTRPGQHTPHFLQLIAGEKIKIYKDPFAKKNKFFIHYDEQLVPLDKKRLHSTLALAYEECEVLTKGMDYLKLSYKPETLVEVNQRYHECKNIPMPTYIRRDSIEWQIRLNYFGAYGITRSQRGKDYSGDFSNISYAGVGASVAFGTNKPWGIAAGVQYFEAETSNAFANVTPRSDRDYFSEVEFSWQGYEIPISIFFNLNFKKYNPYIGLTSSVIMMRNLTVEENFHAPFAEDGIFISSPLNVRNHYGFGMMTGFNRNITPRLALGLEYRFTIREMNFNLARLQRNSAELPPILGTYTTRSINIPFEAGNMTKFSFFMQEISFRMSYRIFSKYRNFG